MNDNDRSKNLFQFLALLLGIYSFVVILSFYNIADYDLWARLAQGASVVLQGQRFHQDIFAFTPVLSQYIDHEWGAGVILFLLLKLFGPASLMVFKILLALGAVIAALFVGRLNGAKWPALLLLAIPCAAAVIPGFMNVIRCQAVTFFFFSVVLLCLELIRRGRRWPAVVIVAGMTAWVNIHGGFLSGLGLIVVYLAAAFFMRRMRAIMIATFVGAAAATFINPYGAKLWGIVFQILFHPHPHNTDWIKVPLFDIDLFTGFRILFIVAVFLVVRVWDRLPWKEFLPGLVVLGGTAAMGLCQFRHGPLFGIAALAVLGPYVEIILGRIGESAKNNFIGKIKPAAGVLALYVLLAVFSSVYFLPKASFQVLAPVGRYPVREADILMAAKAKGNLAVPLHWGGYAMWRLHPLIKISSDGRNETIYPLSTVEMDWDFFSRTGKDWDRLISEYRVDYVVLDLGNARIDLLDLNERKFDLVWTDGYSALFARKELAPGLLLIAKSLPNKTIEPLDAGIPESWWRVS